MLSRQPRPVDYSQAPTPFYILRGHLGPLTQLAFSPSRPRLLFSGDANGVVAVWDLGTYRPRLVWKPHLDGILSLAQLGPGTLVTHARDNKLHLFHLDDLLSLAKLSPSSFASPLTGADALQPFLTLDVNALNFCRLSLLEIPTQNLDASEGLIAVPSLTKDDHVDVFHVPSRARLHRSIGISSLVIGGGNEDQKTGSVMALQLLYLPSITPAAARDEKENSVLGGTPAHRRRSLHLVIGYESGQVALLEFTPTRNFVTPRRPAPTSATPDGAEIEADDGSDDDVSFPAPGRMIEENEGWSLVWVEKCHRDAVMSIEVSKDSKFVYTVGADHLLVKYRLWDLNDDEAQLPRTHVESTDSPGKSVAKSRLALVTDSHAPRETGGREVGQRKPSKSAEILAVGGWNGDVGIYSGKSLQPLASLHHHRNSVQTLDLAPVSFPSSSRGADTANENEIDSGDDDDDDDDEEGDEGGTRGLLATGGTDTKICLWQIYPP